MARSNEGGADADGALAATLGNPAAVTFLVLFWLTAYVKDAGKFWLIKHASALRQKVVAIGFPFGTWACGLLAYYALGGRRYEPFIGTRWSAPSSAVKLVGFLIILTANVAFLRFRGGHAGLARNQPSDSESEDARNINLPRSHLASWWRPSFKGRACRLEAMRWTSTVSCARKGAVSASGSAGRWVERLDTL